MVASLSARVKLLEDENRLQRRRLRTAGREMERLARRIEEQDAVLSGGGTSEEVDVESMLRRLDGMSRELKAPAIRQFLGRIGGIVRSVSGTLGVVRRELGDTQAENAVLKVCLERAVSSSSGAVDVEVGRERE